MHVMEEECIKPSPPSCEVDDGSVSVAVTAAVTQLNTENPKAEPLSAETNLDAKELAASTNGLPDEPEKEEAAPMIPQEPPKSEVVVAEQEEETETKGAEETQDTSDEHRSKSPLPADVPKLSPNIEPIEEPSPPEEHIKPDSEPEPEKEADDDKPATAQLPLIPAPESPEPMLQPSSPIPEDDDMQMAEDLSTSAQSRTRKRTSSESHSDCSSNAGGIVGNEENAATSQAKRLKLSTGCDREQTLGDIVDGATAHGAQELDCHAEKLRQEIAALTEMARIKEEEWNDLLRLRKFKEELLTRLQRRRRVVEMGAASRSLVGETWDEASASMRVVPVASSRASSSTPSANNSRKSLNSQLMMVPIISSTPGRDKSISRPFITSSGGNSIPATTLTSTNRLILPKPNASPIPLINNNNAQNPIIGEGRQGPILDVRSIIADYRSRHPETVPRRGRRLKSSLSPNGQQLCTDNLVTSSRATGGILNMASLALGSGCHVRTTDMSSDHLNYLISSFQEGTSRPSSADSSRSVPASNVVDPNISFKDVLVQFAKLSQTAGESLLPKNLVQSPQQLQQHPPPPPPPPPPYPEVTLHPVAHSPPPPSSSLLHGILTKSTAARPQEASTPQVAQVPPGSRPTTFSPTLARLLTAPERITNSAAFMASGPVSLNDLLTTSSKSRNEITITPVNANQPQQNKPKEMLDEEEDVEEDGNRLVIDEGDDSSGRGTGDQENAPAPEEVPECQGCHQRAAQFVCAGCGNQWYCSRECQVSAWDEHSEVCSG